MTALDLRGHVAMVTGGSRGIGAAIVRELATAGASVVVNYRERSDAAEALVKEVEQAGGRAMPIAADVSDATAVITLFEKATQELGPVDILVNNAGIAITRGIDDLTEADFDRTIEVNL